jgi:hypothetical protein
VNFPVGIPSPADRARILINVNQAHAVVKQIKRGKGFKIDLA